MNGKHQATCIALSSQPQFDWFDTEPTMTPSTDGPSVRHAYKASETQGRPRNLCVTSVLKLQTTDGEKPSYKFFVTTLIAANDFLPEEKNIAEFFVGCIALIRTAHRLNSAYRARKIWQTFNTGVNAALPRLIYD
jgi:hypothetical protein